ncbi:MAG: hypothetical protein JW866_07940 [Ignavibacteriales bacterium]|nr:hypothetical protein [Ignavibacteriales bacterium]
MKKLFLLAFVLGFIFIQNNDVKAQDCDIMYFCVKYDGGEVDCSDRFTTGEITAMVRLAFPIYYTEVTIQIDKLNMSTGKFEYYDDFPFDVDADMTYIYFPGIGFDTPGFYRVFLLDTDRNTMTSALVEIIPR